MKKTLLCTSLVMALCACQSSAEPSEPAIDHPVIRPESTALASVLRATEQLGELRGALLAECMLNRGFPQPADALRMRRILPEQYRTRSLEMVRLDLGPSTEEEAESYGFGGSTFPIDAGGDGIVVSRHAGFDAAADACQTEVARRLPMLSGVQSQGARLAGTVRSAFIKVLHPQIRVLLEERLTCLRERGYPALDPRRALEADGMTEILGLAGVEPGDEVSDYEPPTRSDVPAGAVRIFPPSPVREYAVSVEELAFSLVYVACADFIDFFPRLDKAVGSAVSRVAPRYARQAGLLAADLHQLAQEVETYQPRT